MREYFEKLGLMNNKNDQNRTWKDGIEFPAPDLHSLKNKKKDRTKEQQRKPPTARLSSPKSADH